MYDYAVFVNSCDAFSDCWLPFFTLYERYWPSPPTTYLNTERRTYSHDSLPIRSTRVAERAPTKGTLSWSDCLRRGLEVVEHDVILYFHDDYFLTQPVKTAGLAALATIMYADPSIGHIGVTHFGSPGPYRPTEHADLRAPVQGSLYSVNTQVGFWRTDALVSLLRCWESAWQFEVFGSQRSRWINYDLLTVVPSTLDNKACRLVDYLHTGVIKGRWHPHVPELLAAHGLVLDYTTRGVAKLDRGLLGRLATLRSVAANPAGAARSLAELALRRLGIHAQEVGR